MPKCDVIEDLYLEYYNLALNYEKAFWNSLYWQVPAASEKQW